MLCCVCFGHLSAPPSAPEGTPLFFASEHGRLDVFEALVDAGADVDVQNDIGATPLHIASRHGQLDVVKSLVAARTCWT